MCFNNTNTNNSSGLLALLASRRSNSAKKPTTVSQKDSTHRELFENVVSKCQNVWILFVTVTFFDGNSKFKKNNIPIIVIFFLKLCENCTSSYAVHTLTGVVFTLTLVGGLIEIRSGIFLPITQFTYL
jgi:hypothetical protein